MSELSKEGGWGAGRARQNIWGGELVRHWPPESVAKEGFAGDDGAVIGASESSVGDLASLQRRWMCPLATEGQDGRCGQHDRKT